MNLLDLIPGEFKRAGAKNGGEYQGGCPWCGDGGKGRESDRFHIWPLQGHHGTYWCRMCGRAGDAIKYLIDHDGMEFKAACAHLGLHPDVLGPKAAKIPTGWQPSTATLPAEIWADHALKFATWCHERLLERPDELLWLAGRGIDIEMVRKYRLGYNPTHAWRERPAWGLAAEKKVDGKLKKLWLPRGLVIPLFAESGRVLRLRIRQPEQSPRYLVIPGSSREPLCSRAAEAMIVVESELDAILLDGKAGDVVGVVAMGNDTAKPTASLAPALQAALHISVALDSDLPRYNETTGHMDLPGAKASRWWLEQFPQAVRVPIVGGKDPGEAYAAGIDLRAWVLAALPPYFHVKADLDAEKARRKEKVAAALELEKDLEEINRPERPVTAAVSMDDVCPDKRMSGGAEQPADPPKGQSIAARIVASKETPADIIVDGTKIVTLKNGRSFCLASNRAEWEELTNAGEIVFSEHELTRLQAACKNMTAEERLQAALTVLDVKEIFSPAWIRRGEVVNHGKI